MQNAQLRSPMAPPSNLGSPAVRAMNERTSVQRVVEEVVEVVVELVEVLFQHGVLLEWI